MLPRVEGTLFPWFQAMQQSVDRPSEKLEENNWLAFIFLVWFSRIICQDMFYYQQEIKITLFN